MSINVGPFRDGSHQCDLNDVTDDKEFDVALAKETGFTYNAVEVRALIVSINVGPLKDGSHQCDLNDVTHDMEKFALKNMNGFTYNAVEVRAVHDSHSMTLLTKKYRTF